MLLGLRANEMVVPVLAEAIKLSLDEGDEDPIEQGADE
jgi:hypothetical protein